jgi:peptidoglycan-N-acetylglucosamine deacetylase
MNPSPNPHSATKARYFRVTFAVLLLLAIYGAWHFHKHHTMPIQDAVNPFWWVRHFEGRDLYDPATGMLFHGNPKLQEVAITIDDGPNPVFGPQILSILKQYQVPATFFVVGVRVRNSPELVQEMVADGDEVGNHTYDHQRLDGLSPHEIQKELLFDEINIYRAAKINTTVMRPPGMQYDPKVLAVTKKLGYVTVSWTVAAKDYLNQSPQFIADTVLDRTENGSIILLHQDTPDTVKALPDIITGLRSRGYRFVTITTMLQHLNMVGVPPRGPKFNHGVEAKSERPTSKPNAQS